MGSSFEQILEDEGYFISQPLIPEPVIDQILEKISELEKQCEKGTKNGHAYGIRHVTKLIPEVVELAFSEPIFNYVSNVLGRDAQLMKGIFFNKNQRVNWKVPYHRDVMIAVAKQLELKHYGPWTKREGVHFVRPPKELMAKVVAVRCHFDAITQHNGALRILPGSHRQLENQTTGFQELNNREEVVCCAQKGSVMFMKPLLLHASSKCTDYQQRRVLHLEFAPKHLLPKELDWHESYSREDVILRKNALKSRRQVEL